MTNIEPVSSERRGNRTIAIGNGHQSQASTSDTTLEDGLNSHPVPSACTTVATKNAIIENFQP